ncbi:hypothetical protein RV10_GL002071 [Enterococcus pallens]|nr:hypothetical protein RV10_GL002071 [Enterococcus pallens]
MRWIKKRELIREFVKNERKRISEMRLGSTLIPRFLTFKNEELFITLKVSQSN